MAFIHFLIRGIFWGHLFVRILLTADLHLLHATQDRTLATLASWVREVRPEVMVVAGDLASASRATDALSALRATFPQISHWSISCEPIGDSKKVSLELSTKGSSR